MRKLIMVNMVTLDGFFADSNHGIDWHVADEEFGAFATEQSAEQRTNVFLPVGLLLAASSMISAEPAAKPAGVEAAVLATVSAYRSAIAEGSLDKLASVVEPELTVLEGMHLNRGWADYRDNPSARR